ncbi:hypothetical protein D3C77_565410 [compost metagenome]
MAGEGLLRAFGIRAGALRQHRHQCTGMPRPGLIGRHQQGDEFLEARRAGERVAETPRLEVVGRGRPPGRLEQRAHLRFAQGLAVEGAW